MKNHQSQSGSSVDEVIDAIHKKLVANREVLIRSLAFGRLLWRKKKNGQVEIELELKL